jgi:hypothetical protein
MSSGVHASVLQSTFPQNILREELERAKGIEPSYAAWEAQRISITSTALL